MMLVQCAIIVRIYRLYYQPDTTFIDANFTLDFGKILLCRLSAVVERCGLALFFSTWHLPGAVFER
ncbi:MAG: hypothetical protein L0H75_10140, partial [Nitrosospira sp.]|nr:hypothetical protein [Nitrosospira sp.]